MVIFNALQTSLSGGIGRYSYELSKAIYNKHEIDFKIVIREEDIKLFDFALYKDLIIIKNIKNSIIRNYYEQFILPKKIYRKYPEALIHYPDTMAPIFSRNKIVITVHDISFKAMSNIFTKKSRIWKKLITKLSLVKANMIIVDTKFTQNEIIRYYPYINKSKIKVIYCGFNNFSNENINYSNIRKSILKYDKLPYILTVSTISPRKNIDNLISAFNLIKNEITHQLIIAGKKGWMYDNIINLVEKLNLNDRVFFTDQINDDELKFLYKNAKFFIYPSIYEGFGLPPLEAMSYGIPTIVSNRTSIPEVCFDAAEYFDPYNYKDIGSKILQLISNNNKINIIKQKGYNRIKLFSWVRCANENLSIYKNLLKMNR